MCDWIIIALIISVKILGEYYLEKYSLVDKMIFFTKIFVQECISIIAKYESKEVQGMQPN